MGEAARYANAFAPALKQAAEAALSEKKQAEERIVTLRQQRDQVDAQIRDIEKQLESIDVDIAIGLAHAAKDAGLKIDVSRRVNGKPEATGTAPRANEDNLQKIWATLPLGDKNAMTIGEIIKAAPVDDKNVISSVVKRLVSSN